MAETEGIRKLIGFIYGTEQAERIAGSLVARIEARHASITAPASSGEGRLPLDETDAFMITYGDQFRRPGTLPLECLKEFASKKLDGILTGIHILPFFPYSSPGRCRF